MDTLTHVVLGACLGEAIAGKQLGKKAILIGALANNIPDADILANTWVTQAEGLLVHRGISHSILVATLLPPLIAGVFHKVFPNKNMPYIQWVLLFAVSMFTHIFIDAFTTYGTGWFEPFSHARVSFNALFIIDPIFTLPLLIAAIILLAAKRNTHIGKNAAKAGLIISCIYLGAVCINKVFVNRWVEKNLADQHISYDDYMSTPTPLNNILWYVIARSSNENYIAYYSILDKKMPLSFERIPKNDSLLNPFKKAKEMHYLFRFSQNYYSADKLDNSIIFSDIRFGQINGWKTKHAPFVFNYNLQKSDSNTIMLQRGRFKTMNGQVVYDLWERIKGI